jgi:hypothetical protein
VCGVVYQGSERSIGCQFTFTCDGSLARRPSGASWSSAQRIAADALSGSVYAPVGHATHYHTLWVSPSWAGSLDHVGTIGAHRFYRNRGAGGTKGAFTMAYAAIEPSVSGRGRYLAAKIGLPADQRIAYAAPGQKGARNADKMPDAADALMTDTSVTAFATAGVIRREFANAGRWKADPLPSDQNKPVAGGAPSAAVQ